MQNRKIALALVFCMLLSLSACGTAPQEETRIRIMTTSFPPYDIVRSVVGDVPGVQVTMLIAPGEEVHSFEPSPKDMIEITESDLLVHVGGESDVWLRDMAESAEEPIPMLSLFSCVELLEEETVEGMQEEVYEHDHEHEHEHAEHQEDAEFDEHIWLDPVRMGDLTQAVAEALCEIDPEYAQQYRDHADGHMADLEKLDEDYRAMREEAVRDTVIFADRFPARYLAERYQLSYYAAFPGCSTQTEASAATVAYLIDRVREEEIPAVFVTEFSTGKMAEALREATGCETIPFHSAENLSLDDFNRGVTYLDLMRDNLESLRKALCS